MADLPTLPAGAGFPLVDASSGEFLSSAVNAQLSATFVAVQGEPADGDAIIWDDVAGQWVPAAVEGGGTALTVLSEAEGNTGTATTARAISAARLVQQIAQHAAAGPAGADGADGADATTPVVLTEAALDLYYTPGWAVMSLVNEADWPTIWEGFESYDPATYPVLVSETHGASPALYKGIMQQAWDYRGREWFRKRTINGVGVAQPWGVWKAKALLTDPESDPNHLDQIPTWLWNNQWSTTRVDQYGSTALTIPKRQSNGAIKTGAPAANDDAATKLYADTLAWATVPASATAAGVAGARAYDANYLYVCVAANTWRRVAIASW
jgi:hypothetical protein